MQHYDVAGCVTYVIYSEYINLNACVDRQWLWLCTKHFAITATGRLLYYVRPCSYS